jgi:hypothetical protein
MSVPTGLMEHEDNDKDGFISWREFRGPKSRDDPAVEATGSVLSDEGAVIEPLPEEHHATEEAASGEHVNKYTFENGKLRSAETHTPQTPPRGPDDAAGSGGGRNPKRNQNDGTQTASSGSSESTLAKESASEGGARMPPPKSKPPKPSSGDKSRDEL